MVSFMSSLVCSGFSFEFDKTGRMTMRPMRKVYECNNLMNGV